MDESSHLPPRGEPAERDAVFVQSRRELFYILGIWLVFAVWTLSVAGLLSYGAAEEEFKTVFGKLEKPTSKRIADGAAEEELKMVFGIPAWVFWSVAVPWVAANVVTFWFCCRQMEDQPLDDAGSAGGEEAARKG